jgi:hypothetical protein
VYQRIRRHLVKELLKGERHCLEIEGSLASLLQEVYCEISGEKFAGVSSGF